MADLDLSFLDSEVGKLGRAASRAGVSLNGIEEGGLRELSERIRLYDLDGVTEITGWGNRTSSRLLKAFFELETKSSERKILRSPDARRLAKEILELFSRRASSPLGRNMFLYLVPTADRNSIAERQKVLDLFQRKLEALSSEETVKLKSLIALFSLEGEVSKSRSENQVLKHFLARRKIIDSLSRIIETYPQLSPLFSDSDRKMLQDVGKTLSEYAGSKIQDADAIISDAELTINEEFRKSRPDAERARVIVEFQVAGVTDTLGLTEEEEDMLRRAAFEGMSLPFEFDRTIRRTLVSRWESRKSEERERKISSIETKLNKVRGEVEKLLERAIYLDLAVSVTDLSREYGLKAARLGKDGISFLKGRNIFLLDALPGKAEVEPVDYSIGKTSLLVRAKPRNVVMLTGANSGGKTTLLTTVASIHLMTLFGLPVPADEAEVAPMPVYLYRRRVTKKIGSLEQALGSLIPIFGDRRRKLVMMDEFEALTEPGAAGRILAGIINAVAATSSLLLLVTHLARETLPHVKLPIRVDGIEATGLNPKGDLVVNRQPLFDHIGSSTPKLIIMKLASSSSQRNREMYERLLTSLQDEGSAPVQTPIALPWLFEGNQGNTGGSR